MQKFLIIALCFAATTAVSFSPVSPFTASAGAIITPKGVVNPVTRCGGVATFEELRVSSCQGLCYFQPGTRYEIEADFIPSSASPSLTLAVKVRVFGSDVEIVNTVLAESSVQPAIRYTVNFSIVPNDILSGQIVVITSNISHTDTQLLEICIQHNVIIN